MKPLVVVLGAQIGQVSLETWGGRDIKDRPSFILMRLVDSREDDACTAQHTHPFMYVLVAHLSQLKMEG